MIDRRNFIKGAITAGAVFPMIAPSRVFGASSPSKLINVGQIGCGSIASGHHYWGYRNAKDMCRVIAVCDPFEQRAKDLAAKYDEFYNDGAKCKIYPSYKELLADKSIDAVSIGSHDHTHVPISIAAAKAGKHVYCEKSLSINMDWSKRLKEVLDKSGTVWQFGTQQRSLSPFKRAVELVRNGYIGNVQKVYSVCADFANPNLFADINTPEEVPAGFDWDMWQHVAVEKNYNSKKTLPWGGWHINEYALGFVSNWGVHPNDIVQWGLDMDSSGPVRVEGTGRVLAPDTVNTVCDWDMDFTYGNGVKLHFFASSNKGRLSKTKYTDYNGGQVVFFGDEGWVKADRDSFETSDLKLRNIKFKDSDWRARVKSFSHFDDFLDACRGGQKNVSPIDVALRSDALAFMADAVVRTGKSLDWDLDKQMAKDKDQHALMTSKQMRSKWKEW